MTAWAGIAAEQVSSTAGRGSGAQRALSSTDISMPWDGKKPLCRAGTGRAQQDVGQCETLGSLAPVWEGGREGAPSQQI